MKHRKRTKPVDQFSPEGELIATFKSMAEAAKATGYQQSNISKCCNGKLNKAGGVIWGFSKERLTTSTNELAELYEEIKDVVEKYCILKQGYSDAITLWILGTYFLEGISVFPRLVATSPTPGCGKSQILKVIKALTHNAEITINPTSAVLCRLDKSEFPIRLVDEADEWLKQGKEATAILNAGFDKSGIVERFNQKLEIIEVFDAFMPLALAGIQLESKLAPATLSRVILISVQKESGGEYADSPRMIKQYAV